MKQKQTEAPAEDMAADSTEKQVVTEQCQKCQELQALNDRALALLESFFPKNRERSNSGMGVRKEDWIAQFQEEARPLFTERDSLENRNAEIRAGINPEVEGAKRRSFARQIEDAIAAGNDEMVAARRAELESLNTEAKERQAEFTGNEQRIAAINQELPRIRLAVFSKNEGSIMTETRRIITSCCDALEGLRQGILEYHGGAITGGHLDRLTKIGFIGPDRPLRARLEGLL